MMDIAVSVGEKSERSNFEYDFESATDQKFDVILENVGDAVISVIKAVRKITGMGLKEAKELVESVPAMLKQGVTEEEANEIIAKIKAVGGEAVMEEKCET